MVFTTWDISQLKKMMIVKILTALILLYLNITHASGYIEKKGVNEYLAFDSTDENKELVKKIQLCF